MKQIKSLFWCMPFLVIALLGSGCATLPDVTDVIEDTPVMHTTSHYPEATRFSSNINEWYDLTARYKKQLFDLDKKDYLTCKIAEHTNQLLLQQQIKPPLK